MSRGAGSGPSTGPPGGAFRRSRVDCPPCPLAPRASACAPADVEAWLGELGLEPTERADRESVTSWDLVLDGRRRARLRITRDPGSVARADLLGALRPAHQRQLPRVVPQAAALERRAAVREVLDRRGRAPAARRRDPRRRTRAWTPWGWRSPASWRSRTATTRRPSSGSRPAAGRPTRRPRPRSTAPASASSPATRRTWPSCWTCRRRSRAGPRRAAGLRRAAGPRRGHRVTAGRIRPALAALVIALVLAVAGPRRGPRGAGGRARSGPRTSPSSRMPPTRSPRGTARRRRGGHHRAQPHVRDADAQVLLRPRVPRGPARRDQPADLGSEGGPRPGGPEDQGCDAPADRLRVTPVQRQGRDDEARLRPARAGRGRQPAGPGGKRPRHAARLGVRVRRRPRELGQRAVPAGLGRRVESGSAAAHQHRQ